jgi:hypothetical protein
MGILLFSAVFVVRDCPQGRLFAIKANTYISLLRGFFWWMLRGRIQFALTSRCSIMKRNLTLKTASFVKLKEYN